MVQPTFAPTTVKGTTSPAVHLAPYEVHGERTTKPTEIIKTRPGPGTNIYFIWSFKSNLQPKIHAVPAPLCTLYSPTE